MSTKPWDKFLFQNHLDDVPQINIAQYFFFSHNFMLFENFGGFLILTRFQVILR